MTNQTKDLPILGEYLGNDPESRIYENCATHSFKVVCIYENDEDHATDLTFKEAKIFQKEHNFKYMKCRGIYESRHQGVWIITAFVYFYNKEDRNSLALNSEAYKNPSYNQSHKILAIDKNLISVDFS